MAMAVCENQIRLQSIMYLCPYLVSPAYFLFLVVCMYIFMYHKQTRIQMKQADAFRMAGIFKGVEGSLVGQVPYGVLTFGSYEVYKKLLLERFPHVKPIFTYALSAILGDLTGSGWLCPSEVVKQQMQAGMYPSTAQALQQIWRKKGIVGLYEGYFGGVARDVPFRVAQLTSFELTKSIALKLKAQRRQAALVATAAANKKNKKRGPKNAPEPERLELSSLEAAVCGAISGSFSAAITAPLDRIKTLLMTDSAAYGGSVASCAAQIFREEGLAGFVKGVGPRVVYIAPSVVIFFVCYEQVQQRLRPNITSARK